MREIYGPEWVDRQDPEVLAALMLHGTIEAEKREKRRQEEQAKVQADARRLYERTYAVEAARLAERRARYLGLDSGGFHEELAKALVSPLAAAPLVVRTETPEDVRSVSGGLLVVRKPHRRRLAWPLVPVAFLITLAVAVLVLSGWAVLGLWRAFARRMDAAAARLP